MVVQLNDGMRCAHCSAEDAAFVCSRCRTARFCSRVCQRAAWPSHKTVCGDPGRTAPAVVSAGSAPPPDLNTSPTPIQDDEWIHLINMDAFPGQDAGSLKDGPEARRQCEALGCGGYVSFRGVAYLRAMSSSDLATGAVYSLGSNLWLPANALRQAAATGQPRGLGLTLRASLPEVVLPGAFAVSKYADMSEDDMLDRFKTSQPTVLVDAQRGWAACSKWTFEWLAEHFGGEEMPASDMAPFFKHHDKDKIQTVNASLKEFVRYVRGEPNAIRALQKTEDGVFYANGWCPFCEDDTLLDDVSDRLYCVQDIIPRGTGPDFKFNRTLTKVFMGPAGTVSRIHHDTYATHVWLSQIRGRKQFIVWAPEDAEYLNAAADDECDGKTSLFDPEAPDYDAYPQMRKARAYSVVVEEGETVILPSRWFHWAKSLTPSITLMRNFVNETNIREHMEIRKKSDKCREEKQQKHALASRGPSRPGAVRIDVLKPGDGKTYPRNGQTLTMHYTGTLASNGAKFDSSYDRGKPLKFKIGVAQVIRGWDEGVLKMALGEKARLHIASDYAYGESGAGQAVPPNSDLVFEVELLAIE